MRTVFVFQDALAVIACTVINSNSIDIAGSIGGLYLLTVIIREMILNQ